MEKFIKGKDKHGFLLDITFNTTTLMYFTYQQKICMLFITNIYDEWMCEHTLQIREKSDDYRLNCHTSGCRNLRM